MNKREMQKSRGEEKGRREGVNPISGGGMRANK